MTQVIPRGTKIEIGKTHSAQGTNSVHDRSINNNNPFAPDVPLHPDPLLKPSTQQNTNKISYNPNINLDFEENSAFHEGIMSKTFQRPDKSFFQNPKELREVINKENLIHNFLPRQADIDKIDTKIQNRLPRSKAAIKNLEVLSEKYVLLDSLLFRIYPEKETVVLAIPEMREDKIITLYHKSLSKARRYKTKHKLLVGHVGNKLE